MSNPDIEAMRVRELAQKWADGATQPEIQLVTDYFESQPPGWLEEAIDEPEDYAYSVGTLIEKQYGNTVAAAMMAQAGAGPESVVQAQIAWIQAQYDALVRKGSLPHELARRIKEEQLRVAELTTEHSIVDAIRDAKVQDATERAITETSQARRQRRIAEQLERTTNREIRTAEAEALPGEIVTGAQLDELGALTPGLSSVGRRKAALQRAAEEIALREEKLLLDAKERKQSFDEFKFRLGITPKKIKEKLDGE